MNDIHVAYTIDIQGVGGVLCGDQMLASAYSIRSSKDKEDNIHLHILYANLPTSWVMKMLALRAPDFDVDFVKISDANLAYMQSFTKADPRAAVRTWSGIVFARLWIPLFLPKQDRVIYLDTDTLVRSSLRPLWEMDMEGKFVALNMGTVPEYGYNSGVIVFDSAAIRAENDPKGSPNPDGKLYSELRGFMHKEAKSFKLPDQTVINRFFAGRIKDLDRSWNYPPTPGKRDPAMAKAAIWHYYEGGKPRRNDSDDFASACLEWNNVLRAAEGRQS